MLAEQAEFIEGSGAFVLDAEAFGEKEQASLERNGSQLLAPDFTI